MRGTFGKHNSLAAKLTAEAVMDIRKRYASGQYTQGALARLYTLNINTVGKIVRGESWSHLPHFISEEAMLQSQARFAVALGVAQSAQTAAEHQAETVGKSLDELLRRDALTEEGGSGLAKLERVAEKALAPERQVDELLSAPPKS